jgi:sigma-B regulation protein RsbQ
VLELKQVIFVGHSVSSMIGMLAAIEHPEFFSHLIMVGPSPCYINDENYVGGFEREDVEALLLSIEKNFIGWADFMAPNVMANKDRPQLGLDLAETFRSTDPVIASQFARATFMSDIRDSLKKNRTPTLLLQSTDDIVVPVEVGKFLENKMYNSTLRIMKATGHYPHISNPQETIDLIKSYLEMKQ